MNVIDFITDTFACHLYQNRLIWKYIIYNIEAFVLKRSLNQVERAGISFLAVQWDHESSEQVFIV